SRSAARKYGPGGGAAWRGAWVRGDLEQGGEGGRAGGRSSEPNLSADVARQQLGRRHQQRPAHAPGSASQTHSGHAGPETAVLELPPLSHGATPRPMPLPARRPTMARYLEMAEPAQNDT